MYATVDSTFPASVPRFSSLEALKASHDELLQVVGPNDPSPEMNKHITEFVRRGVATGAILNARDERASAQSLINFWSSRVSLADVRPDQSNPSASKRLRFIETVLVRFDPAILQESTKNADQWYEKLSIEDKTLARRVLLRLARLAPDGDRFEPIPTSRAALGDLTKSSKDLDALIEALQSAEVIRVTKSRSADADVIELRAPQLIHEWPNYLEWLQHRRKFRKSVEQWDKEGRPDDKLLQGAALQEVLYYDDRNALEREFTNRSRERKSREQGRKESQLEAAKRTMTELKLGMLATRLQGGDRKALLGEKETVVAEEWMKLSEVAEGRLLTPAIEGLIQHSRIHLRNEENRRLQRENRLLWAVLILTALSLLGLAFSAFFLWDARKNAENAKVLTQRLMDAHDSRNDILKAIPIVETNPPHYIALALKAYQGADDDEEELRKGPLAGAKGRELASLRDQLTRDYTRLRNDAMVCLNLSLQAGAQRWLALGPEPKDKTYDVNGVAVNKDATLLAAGCGDGMVRLWKLQGGSPTYLHSLAVQEGKTPPPEILDVAFGGRDGGWLAAACSESGVVVWFDAANEPTAKTYLPKKSVLGSWNRIAWGPPESNLLVSSAESGSDNVIPTEGGLHSWMVEGDGQPAKSMPLADEMGKPMGAITAVTFGPGSESQLFAARNRDGALLSWTFKNGTWGKGRPFGVLQAGKEKAAVGSKIATPPWNRLTSGFLRKARRGPGGKQEQLAVLFAAGENGEASLWDLKSEKKLLALQHPCPVRGVAISPSGHMLATAGRDGKVRIWRLNLNRIKDLNRVADWPFERPVGDPDVLTLIGHKGKLTDVTFGGKGRHDLFLASAADENKVRLWDLSPRIGPVAEYGFFDFGHFAFSPDLEMVAACDRELQKATPHPLIRNLEARAQNSRERQAFFAGFPVVEPIRRIAFHPDGKGWASLDSEGTCRLGTGDGKPPAEIPLTVELKSSMLPPVYGQIVFSASGKLMAFSLAEDAVWVYRLESNRQPQLIASITDKEIRKWYPDPKPTLSVYGFSLDDERNRIALACSKGVILVLDLKEPKAKLLRDKPIEIEGGPPVNAVSFSYDGRFLAAACGDAWVRMVEIESGKITKLGQRSAAKDHPKHAAKMEGVHTSEVKRVSFHPSKNDEFASGGDDGLLCVWKRGDNKWDLHYQFETGGAVQGIRYNKAGDRLGIATSTGQVRVYWFDPKQLMKVAKERLKNLEEK
jgi:WD40 repeat protein